MLADFRNYFTFIEYTNITLCNNKFIKYPTTPYLRPTILCQIFRTEKWRALNHGTIYSFVALNAMVMMTEVGVSVMVPV